MMHKDECVLILMCLSSEKLLSKTFKKLTLPSLSFSDSQNTFKDTFLMSRNFVRSRFLRTPKQVTAEGDFKNKIRQC